MPRETSRPKKGAHRLPIFLKCIPKAFNFTPTSAQYNHYHVTVVAPQENQKNTHKEPTEDKLLNNWRDPSL